MTTTNQHSSSPSPSSLPPWEGDFEGGQRGRGPRIQSFDLARGFTVLIMPSIHVVMLYSQPAVQHSLLGDILAFIAEGPGAQLFMLLMGVNFVLASPIGGGRVGAVLQRAFYLLLAAYGLNFLKFIVPLGLGQMPDNLLQELHLHNDFTAVTFFLLIGDILHFAAIAYIILFLVSRLKHYPYWAAAFAMAIMLFSPLLWDLKTGINFVDRILILFNGHPPAVFFPVFPWLVYPLIGLTLGFLLKNFNQDMVIRKAGFCGLGMIIISASFPDTPANKNWLPFYRTAPVDTIFHLGFVLTWLAVIHWLSKKIGPNLFFNVLTFCSKNITSIYFIQWVSICWCLSFTGYLRLNINQSFCWMIGITTFTLMFTYALNKSNAKPKSI